MAQHYAYMVNVKKDVEPTHALKKQKLKRNGEMQWKMKCNEGK